MRELTLNEMEEVSGGNLWGVLAAASTGVATYVFGSIITGSEPTSCGALGAAVGGVVGFGASGASMGNIMSGFAAVATFTTVKEYCEAYDSH
ncbi:hypothetical protein N9L75_07520 [Porticoccaceae bacterium]|nr:hypothetical protein [Porticoccaceae bacterium]MDA8681306.1 hypothetical protein [Porticoccaceae bacterium]